MTHIVTINDQTPKGILLIGLLKEFEKSRVVTFLTNDELEEWEDAMLLKMMEAGRKSGKVNTKRVLKKLGIE